MREEILKRFFVGEVGADILAAYLDGSMVEGEIPSILILRILRRPKESLRFSLSNSFQFVMPS